MIPREQNSSYKLNFVNAEDKSCNSNIKLKQIISFFFRNIYFMLYSFTHVWVKHINFLVEMLQSSLNVQGKAQRWHSAYTI